VTNGNNCVKPHLTLGLEPPNRYFLHIYDFYDIYALVMPDLMTATRRPRRTDLQA